MKPHGLIAGLTTISVQTDTRLGNRNHTPEAPEQQGFAAAGLRTPAETPAVRGQTHGETYLASLLVAWPRIPLHLRAALAQIAQAAARQ